MSQKQCNHCLEWKDEEDFNWRYKSLGIRHPTCRECAHQHNKNYFEGDAKQRHLQQVKERKKIVRELAKEFVYQYLLAHPCSQYGESDPRVLEFHHTGEKEDEISAMIGAGYSLQSIAAEIERCIVLCANCHRKITVEERGWFRSKRE